MQQISGRDAHTVLTDPAFVVPPVPDALTGVAWLRSAVARFSSGHDHERRRASAVAVLDAIPPESLGAVAVLDAIPPESLGAVAVLGAIPPERLRAGAGRHPVEVLARAMGCDEPVVALVDDVAQAYQPGTGDETRADAAVDRLVAAFGGVFDEPAAARIGVLVQACRATTVLIDRARHATVDDVLRDDPPVPATRRQASTRTTVGDLVVEAGEVVLVPLTGDLAFGAGPHRCPGEAHARALAAGAPA